MVDKSLSVHISGGTELIFWIFVRKKPWCQQFDDIEDMKPTPGICSHIFVRRQSTSAKRLVQAGRPPSAYSAGEQRGRHPPSAYSFRLADRRVRTRQENSVDDIRQARTRSGWQTAECVLGRRTVWGWAVGRPWKTPGAAPTRYPPVQPGSQSRHIPRSHHRTQSLHRPRVRHGPKLLHSTAANCFLPTALPRLPKHLANTTVPKLNPPCNFSLPPSIPPFPYARMYICIYM